MIKSCGLLLDMFGVKQMVEGGGWWGLVLNCLIDSCFLNSFMQQSEGAPYHSQYHIKEINLL